MNKDDKSEAKRRASSGGQALNRRQLLWRVGAGALAGKMFGACSEDVPSERGSSEPSASVPAPRRDAGQGKPSTPVMDGLDASSVQHGGDSAAEAAVEPEALSCVVTPAQIEGPFFSDAKLHRSNLLEGETDRNTLVGTPLSLRLGVYAVDGPTCRPLRNAQVDIWHADTTGVYSGFPPNLFQQADTVGKTFCRGYQQTDDNGMVSFVTNFPGWYGTRAVHIHFKVRTRAGLSEKFHEFTSQFYFDDDVNDVVMARAPYEQRGTRQIRNKTDQVYNGTGFGAGPDLVGVAPGTTAPGVLTTIPLVPDGAGYAGVYMIGLRLT
ncbi:MAG: twin-arginine translocation pathway signal protein [Polyangiales bacterium]